MNAHTPFDANQDWSNPYCRNSSNDPMVDSLLGNAYHVVRAVYCNLGNLKLLYDFLNQYGMVIGVQSEAELKALTADAKYARIYGFSRAGDRQVTDYLYVEGDRTGIIPDDPEATGSWITVATSGSTGGGGGTSSGEGAYIPWVYANGSATGGETTINVPDGTVGVPFIIVNGDMQYVGRGFEFNVDSLSVTLAQPLEEGDEVVFLLTGVPAVPDNPHVNDWVQINWLYNNGAAVGGEQVITIPYTFQSVPAVYKNGLRLYKGLTTESYTADPDNQRILLTEPLATNDRLIIQIGGEVQVLEALDHTLQEVARAANVKDSEVILSTDTTQLLNGKKVIYDVVSQRIYGLPTLPTNVYITSVSDGQLTYSPGNITVTLLDSNQQQNTRELWRRSLAEAGLTLVDGSFEEGATVNSKTDAVWHMAGGQCYSWDGAFPKTVPAGSTPATSGGVGAGAWFDRTQETLRVELINSTNASTMVGGLTLQTLTSTQAKAGTFKAGDSVYISDLGSTFTFKTSRYLIEGQSASEITFDDNMHILVTSGGMLQFADFDKIRSLQATNASRFAAAIKDRTTTITIDCYGDSITFGQALADTVGATNLIGMPTGFGDGSSHDHWQFNNNYPQWIASYLADNLRQSSTVNNFGYSGDRAISGYLRHRVVSGSLAATIGYGINDCLFATSNGSQPDRLTTDPLYSVVHYKEALRLFAAKQILQGKSVIILSTTPFANLVGFDGTQLASMKLCRAYNAAAKQVANEFGCRYVDVTQDIFNQYGIMEVTQEATHLNEVGLKIAGSRIAAALVTVETENRVSHGSVIIANPSINSMLSKDAINVLPNATSSTPKGVLSSDPTCVSVGSEWVSIPFYAESNGLVAFVNGVSTGTPPIVVEVKLDFGAVQSDYHYQHAYLNGKPVSEKLLTLQVQPFNRDNQNISSAGSSIIVVANRGWHTLSIRKVSGTGSLLLDSVSFEALESVIASDVYGVTSHCSVSAGILDSGARNISTASQDYPGEFAMLFTQDLHNNRYTIAVDVDEIIADPVTITTRYKATNMFAIAFNKWNGTDWVKFVPTMFTVKTLGGR